MSEHVARVEWSAEGDFPSGRYSRAHRWRFDGGQVVSASASPSVVPSPWSDAAGVDPEEALVASASACHMLWFLDLARRDGLDVETYEDDAVGTVGRDGDGNTAMVRIVLAPGITLRGDTGDEDRVARLHERAHHSCFVANSLKTAIVVEPRTLRRAN